MSSNGQDNQNEIRPPNLPLEEGRPIVYNNCTFISVFNDERGKQVMIKKEVVNTNVQADKIEGSAIGKENKATSINLDSFKTVLIIFAIVVSFLLVVATIIFITSNGQINLFLPLRDLIDSLVTNS